METADSAAESDTILADLELSRSLTIQWAVVGTMGFGVALGAFSALYQAITGRGATYNFAPAGVGWWTDPLNLLVILVLALAIVVPHEWLHGLAIRYYGGDPRYGVGVAQLRPPVRVRADQPPDHPRPVPRRPARAAGLTLVGVPVMLTYEWGWLVLPLAANAGGAVGDLWMALTILSYPSHVHVEDHRTGIRILGRSGDRPQDLSVSAAVWDALVGLAYSFVRTYVQRD